MRCRYMCRTRIRTKLPLAAVLMNLAMDFTRLVEKAQPKTLHYATSRPSSVIVDSHENDTAKTQLTKFTSLPVIENNISNDPLTALALETSPPLVHNKMIDSPSTRPRIDKSPLNPPEGPLHLDLHVADTTQSREEAHYGRTSYLPKECIVDLRL